MAMIRGDLPHVNIYTNQQVSNEVSMLSVSGDCITDKLNTHVNDEVRVCNGKKSEKTIKNGIPSLYKDHYWHMEAPSSCESSILAV